MRERWEVLSERSAAERVPDDATRRGAPKKEKSPPLAGEGS